MTIKNLVFNLFNKVPIIHIVCGWIIQSEGGEMKSETLRDYYQKKRKMKVGFYTYGCFTQEINAFNREIEIGRYCSFAQGVRCVTNDHHHIDALSTSPIISNKQNKKEKLQIGNDVWIGSQVIITEGCRNIGNGVVVAAGSVVTHDLADYGVYGGVPSKLVKKRFNDELIDEIEKSLWWKEEPDVVNELNSKLLTKQS